MIHIDFETRSTVDLKAAGVYIYAEHPTTDVWCACYALDDGPIKLWRRGEPCPPEFALKRDMAGHVFTAHNAQFERIVWREILAKRYGWPEPVMTQWRCTMSKAYAMALPGSLEAAGAAVGLEVQKDMAGRRLMLQMSRPRSKEGVTPIVWWDDEARLQRLYAYCKTDVEAERELDKRLLDLRPAELELWFLDQRINDRGVSIDRHLCLQAKKVVYDTTLKLNDEMRRLTGGAVSACSNIQELTGWLRQQLSLAPRNHPERRESDLDSIRKDVVIDLLIRDDLSPTVRRALELRQEAGKTSTAKIDALLKRADAQGRMRGNLQYHGAGTGRWAARGAQLQNLPRPTPGRNVDTAISVLSTGDAAWVEAMYG